MKAASLDAMAPDRNERIADVITREQTRLRNFIRRRVPDPRDAEDILQEVFYELVEANRLLMPIDHVTGWLFRVARNRIVDLFRRKAPDALDDLAEMLPSPDDGPEAAFVRHAMIDELTAAIGDLPQEQRDVFIGHELRGRSFKDMARETGVSVNTLLSRKHYAVLQLRERLQRVYDEFTRA